MFYFRFFDKNDQGSDMQLNLNMNNSSSQIHRLREIMDIVNDAIFIHDPSTGKILEVNKKACDSYQYSRKELKLLTTNDISSGVHPYTQKEAIKLMKKAASGKPQLFEWHAKKKNGDLFWIEVNVQLSNIENQLYLIAIERDITDKKIFIKELEESKRQITSLMSNLPGMAYRCKNDRDWTMKIISDGCYQLTGYLPSDLIDNAKHSFNDLIIPEDRQFVWNETQAANLQKIPYQISYRIHTKDGEIRWVWEKGSQVNLENGDLEGFIMDITDLKTTELELMESKSQFEAVVNVAPVGILIFNDEQDIIYSNQEQMEIFGYESDDYHNTSQLLKLMIPDEKYQNYIKDELNKRYRDSISMKKDFASFEFNATCKNGQVSMIEVRIAHMGKLHIAVSMDMTARREAEKALIEKTEEMDSFFNLSIDLMCITDLAGQFHRLNPAWQKTLGYSLAELNHIDFLDLVHPEDLQLSSDALSILKGDNEIFKFENRYRCQDVSYRWLEWHAVPFGSLLYLAARDTTDRIKTNDEIRELNAELENRVLQRTSDLAALNKELESFAYSVSHDLRAPLRSISGFSHALDEDFHEVLNDVGKDYLRRITDSASRMSDLIDSLLNLSRVARTEMSFTSLNLTKFANSIAEELRKTDPTRNVEFIIDPDLEAVGDAALINNVLQNLLGNAWKFASKTEKTRIEVGKMFNEGKTVFYVSDNGAGFDMKYANKLFQPFQRLHDLNDFPGSGVGLATVMRIINRHRGSIWAESIENVCTTFYFTLNVDLD